MLLGPCTVCIQSQVLRSIVLHRFASFCIFVSAVASTVRNRELEGEIEGREREKEMHNVVCIVLHRFDADENVMEKQTVTLEPQLKRRQTVPCH